MKKWELARYFIDSKKSVDTMLFLAEYAEKVAIIDIREVVAETKRKFYVNACVVLDKSFPKDKKLICQDEIIKRIYYERDKNFAHKDEDYKPKEYGSLEEIASDMKKQLLAVKNLCDDFLPQQLTVDFVAFDSGLYRLAKGITKEKEEQIMQFKFPLRNEMVIPEQDAVVKKVFWDTEDIRDIPDEKKNEYATIIRMGICMEESIQRLQDDCIKTISGSGGFKIHNGKMPKLGSMEYLLNAANLVKGGITGLSLNGLIDLITPLRTGEFESIVGTLDFKNGKINNLQIYSQGKNLN